MSTHGVFVLGMHRSGTSAVARLVNLLGVPLVADDLLPADDANPKGYWESASLKVANDELLEDLGWSWLWPPRVPPNWDDDALTPARRFAGALGGEWVWKDPRNCVTLDLWLRALDVEPAFVLVHRDPRDVAASLARRDGLDERRALALWERYVRLSLSGAAGHPAYVLSYADLLDDPLRISGELREFLARHGFTVSDTNPRAVREFVDPKLRRARGDGPISEQQLRLYAILKRLRGPHDALAVPELPDETEWVENALARPQIDEARRHANAVEASLHEVLGSRSFRYTAPVRWLVGRLARG